MIVSASQPYFAPYPGFFYMAARADMFVLLDTVQFPRGTTWMSRNRFKNDQGTLWLTVPVSKKGLGLQSIDRVRICREGRWPGKHLASLETAYRRAPFFSEHHGFLSELYTTLPGMLVELNLGLLRYLRRHLDIRTPFVCLSQLDVAGRGTELLVNVCRRLGAERYLAKAAARPYLHADLFRRAGIALEFCRSPVPVYPQLWGRFIANLSAFDLLFNCGPKAGTCLRGEI